jgi:hypothetical protein
LYPFFKQHPALNKLLEAGGKHTREFFKSKYWGGFLKVGSCGIFWDFIIGDSVA